MYSCFSKKLFLPTERLLAQTQKRVFGKSCNYSLFEPDFVKFFFNSDTIQKKIAFFRTKNQAILLLF